MLSYCLVCKYYTENKDIKMVKTKKWQINVIIKMCYF